MMSNNYKKIAIIATLDTKGPEVAYIKALIEKKGIKTYIIDSGIRGKPIDVEPNITRYEVAKAGGSTIKKLVKMNRGLAVEVMVKGLSKIVPSLYKKNYFNGVFGVGGEEGTILATAAMKELPIGVPKLMISPVASGNYTFGPFIGTKDITIMHSVIDILGINEISKKIFNNAVGAIVGMVNAETDTKFKGTKLVAATMMGNTTPALMRIKRKLEEVGGEIVIFHSTGTGGPVMETLIKQEVFSIVLDYTPHEITDYLYDGHCSAGPDRMDAAGDMGIPQIIVPGCTDFIVFGTPYKFPEKYKERPFYPHNPNVSLVRTNEEEMRSVGEFMVEKIKKAKAPVTVFIPLKGLSMYCHPGEPIHNPKADHALFDVLRNGLTGLEHVKLIEVDAHINVNIFADKVADELIKIL